MKLNRERFSELTLVLENDGEFYKGYKRVAEGKTYGQRRSWFGEFLWAHRTRLRTPWSTNLDVEDRDQLRRYFDERYEIPQNEENKYAHIPNVWQDPPESGVEVDEYAHLRQAIREGRKVQCWDDDDGWHDLNRDPTNPDRVFDADVSEYRVDPYWLPARPSPTTQEPSVAFYSPNPLSTPKEPAMTATKSPIVITTKTFVNGQDIAELADSSVYSLIAQQEADIKELEKIEAKPKKLVAEIDKRKAGIAALVAYLDSKE